jgi:hypothetical protein
MRHPLLGRITSTQKAPRSIEVVRFVMNDDQHEGEHDSPLGGSEPGLAPRQQRAPLPAPLKSPRIRESFGIRPAPVIWSHVLIPAVSVGAPLLVGAVLDKPSAGIIASLGGFTGQYALDTPYRRRAGALFWVGAGFVATIAVATLSAPTVVGASLGLGAIALVATFLCGALNIGAPAGSCSSWSGPSVSVFPPTSARCGRGRGLLLRARDLPGW